MYSSLELNVSGEATAQTGIPVANLFGLVISAHFRIKLSASLTARILGLMGWCTVGRGRVSQNLFPLQKSNPAYRIPPPHPNKAS